MNVSASGTSPYNATYTTTLDQQKALKPSENENSSAYNETTQNDYTVSETQEHEPRETTENEDSRSGENSESESELTTEEKQQVKELQARDIEVRAHEAAHIAAGAGVVSGGASFSYQTGPDGKQYAIGGEVPIDMSEASTPEATIAKMQQARAAAMAPADPSPTDYRVAASASMIEMKAQAEMTKERMEEATRGVREKEAISAYESSQ